MASINPSRGGRSRSPLSRPPVRARPVSPTTDPGRCRPSSAQNGTVRPLVRTISLQNSLPLPLLPSLLFDRPLGRSAPSGTDALRTRGDAVLGSADPLRSSPLAHTVLLIFPRGRDVRSQTFGQGSKGNDPHLLCPGTVRTRRQIRDRCLSTVRFLDAWKLNLSGENKPFPTVSVIEHPPR